MTDAPTTNQHNALNTLHTLNHRLPKTSQQIGEHELNMQIETRIKQAKFLIQLRTIEAQ